SGKRALEDNAYSAGISLRAVKSPLAPMMTTVRAMRAYSIAFNLRASRNRVPFLWVGETLLSRRTRDKSVPPTHRRGRRDTPVSPAVGQEGPAYPPVWHRWTTTFSPKLLLGRASIQLIFVRPMATVQ